MGLFESANVFARRTSEAKSRFFGLPNAVLSDEMLLNCVLDHASIILWAIDEEGKFLLSRGAGLNDLGMTDNQIVGQNAFEVYAAFPEIQQSLREGLNGKDHHDIVEVNGAIFESWYCPMRDEKGRINGVVGISTTITELASARKELLNLNSQLHWAFQRSPVLMAVLAIPSGEILSVNRQFEELSGYSEEETRNTTVKELGVWDCPFLARDPDYDFSSLTSFHDEALVLRTKTGERRHLIASGAKIIYRNEPCVLLFARDVTGERETRQALKKTQRRFELIARQASVGIFQCDANGEIQEANDYFWNCFPGLAPQHNHENGEAGENSAGSESGLMRVYGLQWHQLFDASLENLSGAWNQVKAQGLPFRRELLSAWPHERMEWALLEIHPLLDDDAELYLGTIVDITAMKRAESASILQRLELEKAVRNRTNELEKLTISLRNEIEQRKQIEYELQLSKENLQAVVKNAVDYIIHINREGKIEFINHVAPGLTPDQVIGSQATNWLREDQFQLGSGGLQRIFEHNELISEELTIDLPTGETRIYAMRGAPIQVEGETIGASLVARDITRERELEQQYHARLEELSHLSRLSLVGEMSASMSHELKQPLLAIGNYAFGCLNRMEEGTIEQQHIVETMQKIYEMSRKSCDILQRTRNFVSKSPFQPQPSSVPAIIHDSLQFVHAELRLNHIEIHEEFDADLPQSCLDRVQIQQVIVNLLVNAIDAIVGSRKPGPHVITLSAKCIKNSILLRIQDTADGILPEILDGLFNPFKTSKPKGLGMGLAISRGIVENHGGIIRCVQSDANGTIFEMNLPVC